MTISVSKQLRDLVRQMLAPVGPDRYRCENAGDGFNVTMDGITVAFDAGAGSKVATRTIRAVTGPLDRLMALMEEKPDASIPISSA